MSNQIQETDNPGRDGPRCEQRLVRRWVASATVESVRKEDGAQCIRYGPDIQDVTWFTGPDRIGNIKEDKGDLYYESSPSRGRHVFLPNDNVEDAK